MVRVGPPPMLNACPAIVVDVLLREQERVDQIVDEEDVAHLQAVAVERDRLAARCARIRKCATQP